MSQPTTTRVSLRKPHVDQVTARMGSFSDEHNRKLADWAYAGSKRVELNPEGTGGPLWTPNG